MTFSFFLILLQILQRDCLLSNGFFVLPFYLKIYIKERRKEESMGCGTKDEQESLKVVVEYSTIDEVAGRNLDVTGSWPVLVVHGGEEECLDERDVAFN
ncbi:hypothetical protein P8452_09397 [Trifolium repens]|nr:hypothetical protein P8452_09397 [Trifolium repens]